MRRNIAIEFCLVLLTLFQLCQSGVVEFDDCGKDILELNEICLFEFFI